MNIDLPPSGTLAIRNLLMNSREVTSYDTVDTEMEARQHRSSNERDPRGQLPSPHGNSTICPSQESSAGHVSRHDGGVTSPQARDARMIAANTNDNTLPSSPMVRRPVPIEPRPNPVEGSSSQFEASNIESILIDNVVQSFGSSLQIRRALIELVEKATNLDKLIDGKGAVHCLVTCTNDGDKTIVYPVVSKLMHAALDSSNPRASIASQAIIDAFLVARKISSFDEPDTSHTELPTWFPWKGDTVNINMTSETTTASLSDSYRYCNNSTMEALSVLDARELANIYGEFFNILYDIGYSMRMVTGRMTYNVLTPPWLRTNVVFIYGPTKNISIPYNGRVLPRKNVLRERGRKQLGCAILSTWLQRETSGQHELIRLLQRQNVRLPINFNHEVNGTSAS